MITALVGAQFGSEGKGLVAGHIARDYGCHVRVGAANAGHTLYVADEKFVVQQLPCAAYANPRATLVLGAGALIDLDTLEREIEANTVWRDDHGLPPLVLKVDKRAHVVLPEHREEEAQTDLAARIGSTSTIAREGIGVAQAAKVLRRADCVQAGKEPTLLYMDRAGQLELADTVEFLHEIRHDTNILLEGTQGTGLSINHGFFPYCTSRETTATGLAADCGIGPRHVDQVIMVARTFPIRVAGNSGPFWPGSDEISFETLGVQPEKTTVTKLTRRIATFSMEQVVHAARLNSASHVALTFCDYIAPSLFGERKLDPTHPEHKAVERLARDIEQETGCPVVWLGTGPASLVERYEPWVAWGGSSLENSAFSI